MSENVVLRLLSIGANRDNWVKDTSWLSLNRGGPFMNRCALLLVSAFLIAVRLNAVDVNPPTIQPVANPDFAKVLKNSGANPINVLANDIGAGLRVTAVTQGAHGTVAIISSPNTPNPVRIGITAATSPP